MGVGRNLEITDYYLDPLLAFTKKLVVLVVLPEIPASVGTRVTEIVTYPLVFGR